MTSLAESAPASTAAPIPSPLTFCEPAAAKVAEMIAEEGNPALKLRVYVTGGGCSGFQYGFAFESNENEDDMHVVQSGVTLLVDPMSLQYLVGAEIDFEDGLEGSRFVIRNPNATASCGCGSSFSV
ncbi:MAG: iron-sulfur cluster insertion protein ErpA [Gammaproteobacteria bacterium]|jgi:iron-sulfur cluster assembly accessory protein|nr:iron-sulfur cluster insertion protein ErpA [Gammaproteobacteria bacterium]MBU0769912.1 iron-sulfur cluster insertion protein ErpA [Gammaproteobacteria bacterium]MBU0856283.1 iron-sulfur cluster insertion protein ErpA [Gammaproteobacteria bacterium]MBU1847764.1 iron-sulfur cluster insertion protein ErpA [Gammaproteobacteria bacterium]